MINEISLKEIIFVGIPLLVYFYQSWKNHKLNKELRVWLEKNKYISCSCPSKWDVSEILSIIRNTGWSISTLEKDVSDIKELLIEENRNIERILSNIDDKKD